MFKNITEFVYKDNRHTTSKDLYKNSKKSDL